MHSITLPCIPAAFHFHLGSYGPCAWVSYWARRLLLPCSLTALPSSLSSLVVAPIMELGSPEFLNEPFQMWNGCYKKKVTKWRKIWKRSLCMVPESQRVGWVDPPVPVAWANQPRTGVVWSFIRVAVASFSHCGLFCAFGPCSFLL